MPQQAEQARNIVSDGVEIKAPGWLACETEEAPLVREKGE
jgi:hypothetical protein